MARKKTTVLVLKKPDWGNPPPRKIKGKILREERNGRIIFVSIPCEPRYDLWGRRVRYENGFNPTETLCFTVRPDGRYFIRNFTNEKSRYELIR